VDEGLARQKGSTYS